MTIYTKASEKASLDGPSFQKQHSAVSDAPRGIAEKIWLCSERRGKSLQWKVPLLNLTDCGCVGSRGAETDLPFGQETHAEYYITSMSHTHTYTHFPLLLPDQN